MKLQILVGISCLICLSVGKRQEGPSIDKSARVGKHSRIDDSVIIKANAKLGDYVRIDSETYIGKDVVIGQHSTIGKLCTLNKKVILQDNIKIGDRNIIDEESILKNYCVVGNDVKMGYRVTMNEYSRAGSSSSFGDDSMLERYARTGFMAKLQSKAYVGFYSSIGDRAFIGKSAIVDSNSRIGFSANLQEKAYVGKNSFIESLATVDEFAVVHKNVVIPSKRTVQKGEVVIETPSSLDLYTLCTETVSDEQAAIATPSEDGSIKPEFNDLLRKLIDDEMNALKIFCAENERALRPKSLPQILSLYLIQYHGLDSFKKIVRQVKYEQFDTLRSEGSLKQILAKEFHFGRNSEKNVLESDVRKTLVQLLTIDQDAEREYRVKDDSFCKMLEQLRIGERLLSLSERE